MKELAKVKRAADKVALSRAELEVAMREAVKAGASFREVADAAGVSHETVRRWTVTVHLP